PEGSAADRTSGKRAPPKKRGRFEEEGAPPKNGPVARREPLAPRPLDDEPCDEATRRRRRATFPPCGPCEAVHFSSRSCCSVAVVVPPIRFRIPPPLRPRRP